jgi:hypothetical protein
LVNAEKAPLITIILVSILIGVLALFSAYFQRFLFAQFYDTHFPTSGWLYFGLITGTVIIKFLLFNVKYFSKIVRTNFGKFISN